MESGLGALRMRVSGDAALAQRLKNIAPERFVDDVVALAAELGLDVTVAELEAAIAHGRREWTLRWIG